MKLKKWPLVELQSAVLIYDKDDNLLCRSSDFVYFRYETEQQWQDGYNEFAENYGYFYINEEDGALSPELAEFYAVYSTDAEVKNQVLARNFRMKGKLLESGQFIPYSVDYITKESIKNTLIELGHVSDRRMPERTVESYRETSGSIYVHAYDSVGNSVEYSLSDWDREGRLEWKNIIDHTEEAGNDTELVTIYVVDNAISLYSFFAESPIKYYGKEFDNLSELTSQIVSGKTGLITDGSKGSRSSGDTIRLGNSDLYSLFGTFMFEDWFFMDIGFGPDGNVIYNTDVELTLVTAIYCHPLKAAAEGLMKVYFITGAIAVLIVIFMRISILRNLIMPVEEINKGIEEGWKAVFLDNKEAAWDDAEDLYINYRDQRDYRRTAQNEITRLNTALDYAKEAEENRRQLTSSIAHELKTPLAIVRSYAEGLQEHIAEEKRDKYLEIIVSETDRMDAMVLEMLDLSRLEAGKVKLAQDDFRLGDMISQTFEKFETLAAEKGLQISMDIKGELNVTADEARLGQVVTNFVSNAVRYTPHGGEIRVRAYARGRETFFFIENTGKHFTEEEKQKIWETFYRTDKSRSSKGTGLGLAIAKNIVELHGGKVFVYNTELGVQFGFEI